jgi:hypothetical protein
MLHGDAPLPSGPAQEQTCQMSGLDDLDTGSPVARRALRDSFGFWVREVGVDALHVDAAFCVPPDFFTHVLHARDARAPGLAEVSRRTVRREHRLFSRGVPQVLKANAAAAGALAWRMTHDA